MKSSTVGIIICLNFLAVSCRRRRASFLRKAGSCSFIITMSFWKLGFEMGRCLGSSQRRTITGIYVFAFASERGFVFYCYIPSNFNGPRVSEWQRHHPSQAWNPYPLANKDNSSSSLRFSACVRGKKTKSQTPLQGGGPHDGDRKQGTTRGRRGKTSSCRGPARPEVAG